MTKAHRFKNIFLSLFFVPFLAYGEVKVRSFVNPFAISPQDNLTLTVEVEYGSPVHINDPRLPDLNAFHLVGQNQSHQIHIINGNRTNKQQYQYVLQPKREGKFKLGVIEVVVEGQVYKTTPQEEIEVSAKIKPKSKSRSFSFGFGKRGFGSFFSDPFFEKKTVDEKDIFLKLKVDKTKAYVGEMILAEWFFYFPLGGSHFNSEVTKSPTLNGFWVESIFQLGASSSFRLEQTTIKDRPYGRQKLIANALFPIQAGQLTIGALQAKNWPADLNFFFGGSANKPIIKKSNTQIVNVIPLPKEGRGQLWTSAVGDFLVSAKLSKNVVSVSEPLVYKVHFKGVGHPKWIRLPKLNFGPNLTVYDRTESQSFSLSQSQKTYEIILLPKKAGDWLIPSFELSTFDSGLGVYKTHVLPEFKLKVRGEAGPSLNKNEKYFADKKLEEESQNLDQALPKELSSWVEGKPNIFLQNRKTFWLLVYQFLIIFFILSLYKMGFLQKRKSSFLDQELKIGLKQVDKAIRRKDWKKASRELQQLMYDFFSTLLEQEEGAIKNWSVLLKKLPLSVRTKHEKPICDLIARLEKLSFAPDKETRDMQNKKTVLELKKSLLNIVTKVSKEQKHP